MLMTFRISDSVNNLATLQIEDHDLVSYLNKAHSPIQQMKTTLTDSDLQKFIDKIDQMCIFFVLHGLHKYFENVWNQALTNPILPTIEELNTDFLWLLFVAKYPAMSLWLSPHVNSYGRDSSLKSINKFVRLLLSIETCLFLL